METKEELIEEIDRVILDLENSTDEGLWNDQIFTLEEVKKYIR